jgi:hypothetical protein
MTRIYSLGSILLGLSNDGSFGPFRSVKLILENLACTNLRVDTGFVAKGNRGESAVLSFPTWDVKIIAIQENKEGIKSQPAKLMRLKLCKNRGRT